MVGVVGGGEGGGKGPVLGAGPAPAPAAVLRPLCISCHAPAVGGAVVPLHGGRLLQRLAVGLQYLPLPVTQTASKPEQHHVVTSYFVFPSTAICIVLSRCINNKEVYKR